MKFLSQNKAIEKNQKRDEAKEAEQVDDSKYNIPIEYETILKGHTKLVTALAIDASGSRAISGSNDYLLRY